MGTVLCINNVVPKYWKDREVTELKNKKNMFALAIVALILVLGVGYAVVSSTTLTIPVTSLLPHFTV